MDVKERLMTKWNNLKKDTADRVDTSGSLYSRIKSVIGVIVMCLYRLRKVVLAAPVAYYALKIAAYNMQHLPEEVGIGLLSTGEFAQMIGRNMAVTGPLALTAACLVMMFLSRKAMYAWAISVFSLVLPFLLLFSNIYPA